MARFCKNEDCPTSEDLLAFQLGDMPLSEGSGIRRHLAICEFCAAEVEFYENFPPAEDTSETAQADAMPRPLQELAEALLAKRSDDDFFDRLLEEDEDITFSRR
jgi:hypothetical protein